MGKNNKKSEILQITQIKIKLPNKEIELSCEEARQVYSELRKLFKLEEKTVVKKFNELEELKKLSPQKEYIPYPIYIEKYPYWPKWWETGPWCNPVTTICGTTTVSPGETVCNINETTPVETKFYMGDPPGTCHGLSSEQVGQLFCLSIDLTNQTT